jgi:hypothetical protein
MSFKAYVKSRNMGLQSLLDELGLYHRGGLDSDSE